jgi:hypothetical protein
MFFGGFDGGVRRMKSLVPTVALPINGVGTSLLQIN